MADIAAGDVTYTLTNNIQKTEASSRFGAVFKVQFGNGTLTYPSGGIPITKGSIGCPNDIEEAYIMDEDDATGYSYKYDYESDKIRIYISNLDDTTDGPMREFSSGGVAATTLYMKFVGW